jgi:uncharacterized membrane protein YdbT with pleckstrin-like domain
MGAIHEQKHRHKMTHINEKPEIVSGWSSAPTDDEYLIVRSFQHPYMLVLPAVPVVIIMAAAVMLSSGRRPTTASVVLLLLSVPFILRFAWKVMQWWADRLYLTARHIRREVGFLEQNIQTIPLVHVVNLIYRRSILGRILGYGECTLESAGQGPMHIPYMPHECYTVLARLLTQTTSPGHK